MVFSIISDKVLFLATASQISSPLMGVTKVKVINFLLMSELFPYDSWVNPVNISAAEIHLLNCINRESGSNCWYGRCGQVRSSQGV
jgi:hypothetical protein